jgi:NADPH-dependent 2,4-dienoyl-CoA reductase/sulfur reductase-like enzyme
VIVGGGSGAFHCVESLREVRSHILYVLPLLTRDPQHGFKGPITMLTKEPHAPLDRTKLSKALISDASKLEWRSPSDLRIKYGVTLRAGVEVTGIDFAGKVRRPRARLRALADSA